MQTREKGWSQSCFFRARADNKEENCWIHWWQGGLKGTMEKIPTTDRTVSYGLLKIWVFVNKRFYLPRHLIAMGRN
ncbi:hypothetical protein P5673_012895 [Acropora cervicornis]|uniref:Uncharacterized protein n=1 Tax=Acropora cervicornis TaxID=6130 RepID=A0AAD9QM87_ACRCE|nr:hypothetical protein P5673_012895 [Acropora cervicornis]